MFMKIGYNIIILYAFFVVKNDDIAISARGFLVNFYRGGNYLEANYIERRMIV